MFQWTMMAALLAACGSDPQPAAPQAQAPEQEPAPAAQAAPAEEEAPETVEVPAQYKAMFKTVDKIPVAAADKDKVELGRMLYYDTRLSASQTISCNSCHVLDAYGVDHEPTSPGHEGARGARNSPTVFHAMGHVAQFWDGRAADLAEQAKGPVLNPIEMAMPDPDSVVALLDSIPGYQTAFAKAYPDQTEAITYDNMADAIATFERYLVTPSRFDTYLSGDGAALTAEEREGLELFVNTGCTACHMGQYLGGTTYQKLGAVVPYPTEDQGRKEVTGNAADLHVFKVPSLRNVTETAPYFHDGSVATLDEAVRLMAKHQLGKELSEDEIGKIVTFLGALTGEIDKAYITQPVLPPDGPETPGPIN